MIKSFVNPEGHQNPFGGLKVTAILLKGWIWPIGGLASERVCACSLRSRLVLYNIKAEFIKPCNTGPQRWLQNLHFFQKMNWKKIVWNQARLFSL